LAERNTREPIAEEKLRLMAMQVCDFQFAEDFQAGYFAFFAVSTIPGWLGAPFAFRSPDPCHYFANARTQACPRQWAASNKEGSNPTSDC
jgi:hypothetical protein